MGYWLHRTFISQRGFAQDVSATEVFNLPKRGIISNLLLEIMATSGSGNFDTYLPEAISKVEVIGNGSTVIQSLDGRQIQASMAYDDLRWPPDKEISPSGTCWAFLDIRFGRYVGDQKYALDCSKWDSLELKITYNLAAGVAINTTGFTSGSGYLRVTGLFSPDGADLAPVGFLKKSEKKTYTTSTDGSEDLSLPDDYPYRRLLLFVETHEYFIHQGFRYITININDGARKPIDNMGGEELMRLQLAIAGNPMWRQWKRYYFATTGIVVHPPIRWIANAYGTPLLQASPVTFTTLDPNSLSPSFVATEAAHIAAEGYLPWGGLAIDLERQSGKDGVEAMLDCWGYDQKADIDLEFIEWSDALALSIVLEQYASHPV